MKGTRRLVVVLVLVAAVLALAGCQSAPAAAPTAAPAAAPTAAPAAPAPTKAPVAAPTAAPAAAPTAAPAASSKAVADFYRGKNIILEVPAAAGGGWDSWSRVLARYMSKYTEANVIVRNMPGGGLRIGRNWMYNSAKGDGLYLGVDDRAGMLLDEKFGTEGVKYKTEDFPLIGRFRSTTHMLFVSKSSKYKTIEQIKAAPKFTLGTNDVLGTNTGAANVALPLALGLKNTEIVLGWTNEAEVVLALMRGEIDGAVRSDGPTLELVKAGDVIPLVAIPEQRSPFFPDVPTIYELAPNMNPSSEKWVRAISAWAASGVGLYAAKGTPQDKLDFIDQAFTKSMKDPQLKADTEKIGEIPAYMSAQDYKKLIQPLVDMDAKEFRNVLSSYLRK